MLEGAAAAYARAIGRSGVESTTAFYVLLRDWSFDLEALLAEVRLGLDDALLWSRRFDAGSDSQSLPRLLQRETRIREELDLPTSSWTMFAAYAGSAEPVVITLFDNAGVSEGGVKDAIRRLVGSQTVHRLPSQTITSDVWTTRDQLGYDVFADAIAAFIRHPDTTAPLTIGVKAPWGAGKTSVMHMVREALDPGADAPTGQPRIADDNASLRRLTNRNVLRLLRRRPDERDVRLPEIRLNGRYVTVWFNAWKYQTDEQVWAGLADAIVTQVTARLSPLAREHFWMRLNLRRIDTQLLRSKIYRSITVRLMPIALMTVPAAAIGFAFGALPGGAAVGAGAAAAAAWTEKLLGEDIAGTYDEVVRNPSYRERAGFLHAVQDDVTRVLDLVATTEDPLVVFVDDLDRCSHETVRKVVEAINLFLSGEFRQCVFVIGMEPDVVAAHIEVAYRDVFELLAADRVAGEGQRLGWRFLDKMIQLPVSLPTPVRRRLPGFVESVLREEPSPLATPSQVEQFTNQLRQQRAPGHDPARYARAARQTANTLGHAGDLPPEFVRAALDLYSDEFSDASQEVKDMIRKHALRLSQTRNPREIKRFVNALRFYAFIATGRAFRTGQGPDLDQVAKLAWLVIRWPHLVSTLARTISSESDSILKRLEDAARNDGVANITEAHLPDKIRNELSAMDLQSLLKEGPPVADVASGFL